MLRQKLPSPFPPHCQVLTGHKVSKGLNQPLQWQERGFHTHHRLTNENALPEGTTLIFPPFAFILTKQMFKVHLEEQASEESPASLYSLYTPTPKRKQKAKEETCLANYYN